MPRRNPPATFTVWAPQHMQVRDPSITDIEIEIPDEFFIDPQLGEVRLVKIVAITRQTTQSIRDNDPRVVDVMPKVESPPVTDDLGAAGGH